MTREERIRHYEEIFDEAESLLKQMEEDLTVWKKLKEDLKILDEYYTGKNWKKDYEADEAGKLPAGLKRGVLSEDGIYDLLERYRDMKEEYTGLMKGEQGNG
ncbi:MAG: DUF4298 domain-containing protein [Erysipelotrichaceae bacterium]|nr:DUF4298 domain-containing protein [Erysipelotrichaceae bacterium]